MNLTLVTLGGSGSVGATTAATANTIPLRDSAGGLPPGPFTTTPQFPQRTITGSDTATTADYFIFCDTTAGVVTVTLPAASTVPGMAFVVLRTTAGANNAVLSAASINGSATYNLTSQYAFARVVSNGTTYFLV